MNKVAPQPILNGWDERTRLRLLDYMREHATAINQAADGLLSNFVSVSAAYTAGVNDHVIVVVPSGTFTVTLPRASDMRSKRVVVKRGNSTTHTITIQSTSGNIDGAASTSLTTAWQSRELFSDGTQWLLI